MNIELYVAVIDTLILMLLVAWAYMDRHNIYFKRKRKKK